jgi:signal transduction histidine kinase
MAVRLPPTIVPDKFAPGSWLGKLAALPTRFLAPLPPITVLRYRGRFGVYLTLATLVSTAIVGIALWRGPTPGLLAFVFLLACLLSTFYIVEVVPGGSLWTPADFLTFSAIFILGSTGIVAAALGQGIGYALRRRPGPTRIVYTINSDLINATVAYGVYQGAQNAHVTGGAFVAALLTGAAYDFVGLTHLMLGTSLGRGKFVGWSWFGEMRFTLPFTIGYAWAAMGAFQLYNNPKLGGLGLTMVAVPVVLFQGFLVYLARAVHMHQLETQANHEERLNLLQELVVKQRGFVADAAHELRTPLTTVSGGLELMQALPDMDVEQRQELIDNAMVEARRMSNLVNSLLELAELDSGEELPRAQFNWNELIGSAVDEMKKRISPRSLATEISSEIGDGAGDMRRLARIFEILSDNIAAHTPPETTVKLEANRRDDGIVYIALEDDGPGVPSAMIDRTFERFVQLDPSRHDDAPGMGLAIARSIAVAHHGSIGAAEVRPHGLRVVVRIPPPDVSEEDTGTDAE